MIHYPVIEEVKVENYALYPGTPEKKGLHHIFRPEVNVILGINGLGKTTLLNILLRLLTGPIDIASAKGLGQGAREARRINTRYFAERVPDGAYKATATGVFSIGPNKVLIKRDLSDMSLLSFAANGQEIIGAEIKKDQREVLYQSNMSDLTGLSSFFDFLTMLHFMIFYLEGRDSSFWNPETQYELLRILFYNPGVQREYLDQYNELSGLDSRYRNIYNARNLTQRILNQKRDPAIVSRQSELGKLEKQQKSLNERLGELIEEIDNLQKERRDLHSALDTVKYESDQLENELEVELESYYTTFLPDLNATAQILLTSVATGRGCLVCGSTDPAKLSQVLMRAQKHQCPLCASGVHSMDTHRPEKKDFKEVFLAKEGKLKENKSLIDDYLTRIKSVQKNFSDARINLLQTQDELSEVERSISTIKKSLDSTDLEKHEKEIDKAEIALAEIDKDINERAEKLKVILNAENQRIISLQQEIKDTFRGLIDSFMAEQCELDFEANERSIGQRRIHRFNFPLFTVKLSGGASKGQMTKRTTPDKVSESQREFIELAFRVSLLTVASKNQPSMLVLETPEASLDTYFMGQAGKKLREISKRNLTLIATSNLSKEDLVPSMLGIPTKDDIKNMKGKPAAETAREHRSNYILDLLNLAAPTAALEKYRAKYESTRADSIWPEWEAASG